MPARCVGRAVAVSAREPARPEVLLQVLRARQQLAPRVAQHGRPPAARDLRAEDHFDEVAREDLHDPRALLERQPARQQPADLGQPALATASSASRSRPPRARTGRCSRRCPGRARRDSRRPSTTEGRGRSRGRAGSSARRGRGSRARRSSGRSRVGSRRRSARSRGRRSATALVGVVVHAAALDALVEAVPRVGTLHVPRSVPEFALTTPPSRMSMYQRVSFSCVLSTLSPVAIASAGALPSIGAPQAPHLLHRLLHHERDEPLLRAVRRRRASRRSGRRARRARATPRRRAGSRSAGRR